MRARRRVAALVGASALACLAACGSGGSSGAGSSDGEVKAGPVTSPALTRTPAGSVVHVAPQPQGIVYDAGSDTVAVFVRDPDRLLLLDPDTLEQRSSVQLPGKARHVKLGRSGGPVLVPDEGSNRVFEVDPSNGRTTSVEVGKHPHDAVETADGDVVVGNEFGHELSVVRDGKVVREVGGFHTPGGLATTGDVLAALDDDTYSLTTYSLPSYRRIARVRGGEGTTHAAITAGGREVVVDTVAGTLRLFDLDPLRQVASARVGGTPYGLATDPTSGLVWVTLTARNEVVGVDFSGDRPRRVAAYPTVRQPDTVAVDPGSHTLWVTGTRGDEIERIPLDR